IASELDTESKPMKDCGDECRNSCDVPYTCAATSGGYCHHQSAATNRLHLLQCPITLLGCAVAGSDDGLQLITQSHH
ncbi:hypothetical protein AVEN_139057-1, partial [Araneus ventricosus]